MPAGQDQDVLGMAEEPEQMLEQHRIAAAVGGRVVPKLRSVSSMVMAPAASAPAGAEHRRRIDQTNSGIFVGSCPARMSKSW
jgi:hypothetical protein